MEITGKIIVVLPQRSGTSAKGEWASQQYVLETLDQYPKKFLFEVFGADKITNFAIQAGEELTISFTPDAREYNGNWFASNHAWKVERKSAEPT